MKRVVVSVCVCAALAASSAGDIPVYDYDVIAVFPHDSTAFTQGLVYQDGYLYEGTGLYGNSSLRKVELETGNILKIRDLPSEYFGEGITIYEDTIVQLTWRNHVGFSYVEADTFEMVDTFTYTTEGWGLTHDGTHLIMSDGTPVLHFLDPDTYQEVHQVEVTAEADPVRRLNELEYIQGMVYSNVWLTDTIAIIDPETGNVTAWLNLAGLLQASRLSRDPNVLNGIAFDSAETRLFVTGKLWPSLFQIDVPPLNYPPRIISSHPSSPCSAGVDSTLLLSIHAEDPDVEDTLEYVWSLNGEVDTSANDSVYHYLSSIPTVDTVAVQVTDGIFFDSTSWTILVSPMAIQIDHHASTHSSPLLHSYPSPFTSHATITYGVPRKAHVALSVYDAGGRMLKKLVDGEREAGTHGVILDGTELTSGVYFLEFATGDFRQTKKLVLLE